MIVPIKPLYWRMEMDEEVFFGEAEWIETPTVYEDVWDRDSWYADRDDPLC